MVSKNVKQGFFFWILTGGLCLGSCTDVVEVNIDPAADQLVIDAWINNKNAPQTIRLTLSQPYFINTFTPAVNDAQVTLTDSTGEVFEFIDQGDGHYVWTPEPGSNIGDVGMTYVLNVTWQGDTYAGTSVIKRVPAIDTIQIEFRDDFGFADGYYASLFARDFPGLGDTYWIKAYKNDVFLNKPNELNIAYDAGFDAGGELDGVVFIPPIRDMINRFPDPDTEDDFETPPYKPGDKVHVEIHSITNEAFTFLETARDQMSNGDNTIFSIPVTNTRSNVTREGDGKPVLGFFCVSAVSEATRVVE